MRQIAVLSIAVLLASCGGAAAPSPSPATQAASPTPKPVDAVGQTSTKLADGPLAALPTLPLYINILDVPQQPSAPLQHAHLAGFVYAVNGVHRLDFQGGETKNVQPGEGAFIAQDAIHTHVNPGTAQSQWYFIALRNTSARNAPPTFPGQSILYESADLPATALAAGKHMEQLNVVTIEKGGRTPSHKHGGVEMVVVLDGTIQLRATGQPAQTLTKGKGAVIPPNTTLQATNTGDGTAKFLAFFVTPEGQPFSTNVDTLP